MTTFPTGFSGLNDRLSRYFHLDFRVLVAASLLGLLAVLQTAAWAQYPSPQDAPLDPPGRVARLNLKEGAVSFAPADTAGLADRNAWTPAVLNRPLTSGDRLWSGPRARSELHIGSTAVRMSERTSLDFLVLDDNVAQLRLAQGTVQLRVRTLFEGQRLEIDTPNLAFVISQPGDYRLDVNPANNTTRVVAQSGGGVIYGDNSTALNLGSQQQASFSGTQLTPAAPGAAVQDSFDLWAAGRDRREYQSVSARYVPRETIGYQQLDTYGDWHQDPSYGAVWFPRIVPVHWAPYSMGHWSWIAPWGWTWIDDAPWGFAPFHYGRWAHIGPRWCWVPGRLAPRPVYAPALVVFVGGSSGGVNWNISIGSGGIAQPGVGWFPLAPGEAFQPAYLVSPRYVTEVNQNIVVNNTVNVTNIYRYQRQPDAVTAVSRDDFARGRPILGNLHPLSAADLSRAQVVAERSAMPQRLDRTDVRERPSPVAAAALPSAAVLARPVVGSRDERRDDRRDDSRAGRPDNDRNARAQTPVPAAPVTAGVVGALPPVAKPAPAAPSALRPGPAPAQDRSAIDADQRARREQQQLQREQERRQSEATQEQRALREQAVKNGSAPPVVVPDARAAAERRSAEQAQQAQQAQQQAQQQLQRDQQAQKQKQQALDQAAQARQQQAQQHAAQQDQQRQARELQGQQQEQRKTQAQERQKTRPADASNERAPRLEGEPKHNREP